MSPLSFAFNLLQLYESLRLVHPQGYSDRFSWLVGVYGTKQKNPKIHLSSNLSVIVYSASLNNVDEATCSLFRQCKACRCAKYASLGMIFINPFLTSAGMTYKLDKGN